MQFHNSGALDSVWIPQTDMLWFPGSGGGESGGSNPEI